MCVKMKINNDEENEIFWITYERIRYNSIRFL